MMEREMNMFKTLNIKINKVINTEKERHLFLKNNQPLTAILDQGQKYYINIKIFQQLPPLRVFFKPKSVGIFNVYVSRKHSKPDSEENDRIYTSPHKIQIKGQHDEGVFLTESAYFTIIAEVNMKITLGY